MIISDKQELRRCVKQAVRRAQVCEAALDFDVHGGETGVSAMLELWARPAATPGEALRRATAEHTPFQTDAAATFAALDALHLPVSDPDRAQTMAEAYERPAYLREVLDAMRARCVLVRVPMARAGEAVFEDDRLEPLLAPDAALFAPGRYGVDYAGAARAIAEAARRCGARNLATDHFDEPALRYCLLPLCQDEGYALHIRLQTVEQIDRFALLLDAFEGVRALAQAPADAELRLIDAAAQRVRLLVCLSDTAHIEAALGRLGTRFVPFSARAALTEQMLGRWLLARESIWQALAAAYLPLARAGYVLESAAVERDVRSLLSENLIGLCRPQTQP